MCKKILVIGGGISDEREISLQSAQAVFEAIKKLGHEAEFYDWDGSELWLEQNVDRFSLALPILHGIGGEDGGIQQILENSNLPYLGTKPAASQMCFNKNSTQKFLHNNAFLVPTSYFVSFEEYKNHDLFSQPHVLKPHDGGSSIDTFINKDPEAVDLPAIEAAFKNHKKLLLQECIVGDEVTVPILGDRELPVVEIIPPAGKTFDFENKYNGETQELIPPKNVAEDVQVACQKLALVVHQKAKCRDISRIDMIVSDGTPYVLEINTMPGLTNQSLFPKSAAAIGLSFEELVAAFIEMVGNHES